MRALGHNYIGTEHLLLGLIREGEGIASQVLLNLGLDLNSVRNEVMELLGSALPGGQGIPGGPQAKSKTPALDAFGRDLSALAKENKLDPVIDRIQEIERVIQILSRRTKNNPVLLGEAGVGKTAIVEGLAQAIVTGNVPELLRGKRLISLDLALMVAGTKYRGQFEERIKAVMEEIKRSQDVIIFIDELHTLVGAGAAEGAIDASNILKPALSRGEMQCIGATTMDEYRKYIEKDAALERRFQTIMVEPPSVDQTIEILKGLRDKYEAVVHLAARKQVGESVEKPEWYFSQNVGGLANLLTAMRETNVQKLLFSSSAAVYGMPDAPVITEDIHCQPINPYGETKLIGEWLVADAGRAWGLKHVSLRYFNVAGAGWSDLADTAVANLIPIAFAAIRAGKPVRVFGDDYPTADGSCVRDYIHVLDLAKAHQSALEYLDQPNREHAVFNVGTGVGASVFEVIAEIKKSGTT